MRVVEGNLVSKGKKYAIIVSRFNEFINSKLLSGAVEVTKGIAQISLKTGKPVIFGVLTTENIEQAIERAGTKAGNKGYEAAMAAIEMVNLLENC